MNIDGKITSQHPKGAFYLDGRKMNSTPCSKCNKVVPIPEVQFVPIKDITGQTNSHQIYSYFGTKYFIYESKSGYSSVYCSAYCRNKHNHRFN